MSEEVKKHLDRIIALAEGFMSSGNHRMFKDAVRAVTERDEPTRKVIDRIRHTESVERALNAYSNAISRWGREDSTPTRCIETEAEVIREIYKTVAVLEAGKLVAANAEIERLKELGKESFRLAVHHQNRADATVPMIKEANSLLRSAFSIASREGAETNWRPFWNQIRACLIKQSQFLNGTTEQDAATCTPLTFRKDD